MLDKILHIICIAICLICIGACIAQKDIGGVVLFLVCLGLWIYNLTQLQ